MRCRSTEKANGAGERAFKGRGRLCSLPPKPTVSQRQVLRQLSQNERERDQRGEVEEEDRDGAPAEAARGPPEGDADEQDVEVGAREHVREGLRVAERGDEARGGGGGRGEGAAAARGGGPVARARGGDGAAAAPGVPPPVRGGGQAPRGEVARGDAQGLAEGRGGLLSNERNKRTGGEKEERGG